MTIMHETICCATCILLQFGILEADKLDLVAEIKYLVIFWDSSVLFLLVLLVIFQGTKAIEGY
jgi:hypothetical protein